MTSPETIMGSMSCPFDVWHVSHYRRATGRLVNAVLSNSRITDMPKRAIGRLVNVPACQTPNSAFEFKDNQHAQIPDESKDPTKTHSEGNIRRL
nr:hypothetical protein [Tanacetum cinerariifolium]